MNDIYLIRHGGTPGNTQKRYVGSTDEPLTNEWKQRLSSKKAPQAGVIFSSPMKRCLQTADILYPNREIIVIDEFRECDFGRFEYKNYQELCTDPDYQKWIDSGGRDGFPEGETLEAFEDRVEKAFMEKILPRCVSQGFSDAAVITHGGVIMTLLERLGSPKIAFYDAMPENGEIIVCRLDETCPQNDEAVKTYRGILLHNIKAV